MRDIHGSITSSWMILGDFNLILEAQDKNNAHLNRQFMGRFRQAVDDLELKEVHLND